jgi:hypothetical protein
MWRIVGAAIVLNGLSLVAIYQHQLSRCMQEMEWGPFSNCMRLRFNEEVRV